MVRRRSDDRGTLGEDGLRQAPRYPPAIAAVDPKRKSVLRRFVPCVDGSLLARTFCTYRALVGCGHVFGLIVRFT